MVTHVVMFRLKDRSDENIRKAGEVLLSMKGRVEQLRHIEVGTDFLHSERSYDIVLITRFDSKDDLAAYQNHPYHVEVVKKHMHAVRETSAAVDYEN